MSSQLSASMITLSARVLESSFPACVLSGTGLATAAIHRGSAASATNNKEPPWRVMFWSVFFIFMYFLVTQCEAAGIPISCPSPRSHASLPRPRLFAPPSRNILQVGMSVWESRIAGNTVCL